MPNLKLVGVLCLVSGILGLAKCNEKANAAVPNMCPQWACKNLTYWWDGSKTVMQAAYAAGDPKSMTFTGFADVFANVSTYDLPNTSTGDKYDLYTIPACSPQCGKDMNNVWQALQDASPSGNATLSKAGAGRYTCKPLSGFGLGSTAGNANAKAKNIPPGN